MPRDATATRARLLEEAERLFATHGVYQSTVREIVEGAGQRNASALTYHFGSREGVLGAILTRYGDPLDRERGRRIAEPIDVASTSVLVEALVLPMARMLDPEPGPLQGGRNYLRIVAQLTDRFPTWRFGHRLIPPNLRRILGVLEDRAGGASAAVRRERVINMMMLMMTAMAERARALDEGLPLELDDAAFVVNLTDMIVGALEAPCSDPSAVVRDWHAREPSASGLVSEGA